MKLTHWTKHPQRLDRDFGRKSYGDEGYSHEELVAELGSAFLCADLELHQEPIHQCSFQGEEKANNRNRSLGAAAPSRSSAAIFLWL
jgi:antirestriction protein ArdC